MKKLSFVLFMFLSVLMFAQDAKPKLDLKLYANFDYFPSYNYLGTPTNGTNLRTYIRDIYGFNFSPALVIHHKNNNTSEVEISRLRFANNYYKEELLVDTSSALLGIVEGSNNTMFEVFLRYEYRFGLFKNKDWEKFKINIGVSAMPFFSWEDSNPLISTSYPESISTAGLYLAVVPGIEYSISEKFYIDINVPVSLVTANIRSVKVDNPTLPINQRTNSTLSLYQGPVAFSLRFGIGIRL